MPVKETTKTSQAETTNFSRNTELLLAHTARPMIRSLSTIPESKGGGGSQGGGATRIFGRGGGGAAWVSRRQEIRSSPQFGGEIGGEGIGNSKSVAIEKSRCGLDHLEYSDWGGLFLVSGWVGGVGGAGNTWRRGRRAIG